MLITFFLLVSLIISRTDHAIYLSFTEIDVEAQTIRIKVFSDDLENVLRNFDSSFNPRGTTDFLNGNEQILEHYFKKKLLITIDNQSQVLTYASATVENDAHFLRFEFPNHPTIDKIKIKADFFMELFPSQSNVVQVNKGQEKRYLRLTLDKPSDSLAF